MPDFKLNTDAKNRADVIDSITSCINDLPLNIEWAVNIEKAEKDRHYMQNRLHRRWCREIELFLGNPPGYGHAFTKYEYLLPMKLSSDHKPTRERAEYESPYVEMIEHVPLEFVPDEFKHMSPYERKLRAAYDTIRSKTLKVGLFAEWLNEYRRDFMHQGLILVSKSEADEYALMSERKAAA